MIEFVVGFFAGILLLIVIIISTLGAERTQYLGREVIKKIKRGKR